MVEILLFLLEFNLYSLPHLSLLHFIFNQQAEKLISQHWQIVMHKDSQDEKAQPSQPLRKDKQNSVMFGVCTESVLLA